MTFHSEFIYSVTAVAKESGEPLSVHANDINHPDHDAYHYYCADCYAKGREVAMVHVEGASRKFTRRKLDPVTEMQIVTGQGLPIEKTKTVFHYAHWVRASGAAKHKCDNAVRYSDLRSAALYMNALPLSKKSFLFQLRPPMHGNAAYMEEGAADLRSTFRLKGMKMKGVADAKDMDRLIGLFEEDGEGLQYDQYFYDGFRRRAFAETYFEDVREIHRYLTRQGAIGKEKAMMCAYRFNPNNSKEAMPYVPEKDGLIDRAVYKVDENTKMNLFVRAANRQSMEHLSNECYRDGWYAPAPVLIVAESWIEAAKPYQVEMEIYSPFQAQRWIHEGNFAPDFHSVRVIDPRPQASPQIGLTG